MGVVRVIGAGGGGTADADPYVFESWRAAQVVGIPVEDAPASTAELADYFAGMQPQLYACPEAVQALVGTLNPPLPLPRLLRPLKLAVPALVALSFAVLPPWARRLMVHLGCRPPTWPPRLPCGHCVGHQAGARLIRRPACPTPDSTRSRSL